MKKIYNKHIWRYLVMFWLKVVLGVCIGLFIIYLAACFIMFEIINLEHLEISKKIKTDAGPLLRITILFATGLTAVIYNALPNAKSYKQLK